MAAPLAIAIEPGPDVIDVAHLAHMTLGDRALKREVLQLFDRQAAILVERMRAAQPDVVHALAHALKGSARGIGAFALAQAAEALEQAAGAGDAARMAAMDRLAADVAAARVAIARLLHN